MSDSRLCSFLRFIFHPSIWLLLGTMLGLIFIPIQVLIFSYKDFASFSYIFEHTLFHFCFLSWIEMTDNELLTSATVIHTQRIKLQIAAVAKLRKCNSVIKGIFFQIVSVLNCKNVKRENLFSFLSPLQFVSQELSRLCLSCNARQSEKRNFSPFWQHCILSPFCHPGKFQAL